jgi:REP element-mobilizing transposase RayT
MPNTYTQMYVHVIFAVKRRECLITPKLRENLYAYITGITKKKDQKLISINGMPDHIHLLIGFKPDCNLSELIRDIKANSSKWINQNDFLKNKFEWQSGFGAFTIGHSK